LIAIASLGVSGLAYFLSKMTNMPAILQIAGGRIHTLSGFLSAQGLAQLLPGDSATSFGAR